MLTENVKKLLKENMWDLATCSAGVPNVASVAFKDVTDDGKLVVGDVFLDTMLRNLAANGGRIADGPVVATFKAMVEQMFQGADVPCVSRPFLHTCIRGETAVCCRQQTAERSHFYAHCSSL